MSASECHLLLALWRAALAALGLRRPAFGHLRALAEEELFHLLHQQLLRLRVGQVEAIVIDHQRGLLRPHVPGLLRDFVVDSLAEPAGKRQRIQPWQLAAQFYTLHHSWHRPTSLLIITCVKYSRFRVRV